MKIYQIKFTITICFLYSQEGKLFQVKIFVLIQEKNKELCSGYKEKRNTGMSTIEFRKSVFLL